MEFRSLSIGQLYLEDDRPHVVLRAEDEKNREGSTIPLRKDLAADLREWLAMKLAATQQECRQAGEPIPAVLAADQRVFNLPGGSAFIKAFDHDLKAAGISKRDERGRTVDLYSLRMSFCTHLSKGGVPLRTAQAAMRHNNPLLTANVYTDPQLLDVEGALDVLPRLSLDAVEDAERVARTGTDDRDVVPSGQIPEYAPEYAPTAGRPRQFVSSPGKTDTAEATSPRSLDCPGTPHTGDGTHPLSIPDNRRSGRSDRLGASGRMRHGHVGGILGGGHAGEAEARAVRPWPFS